jgi:hypothetical protein
MPRVFVVNRSSHDLSKAEPFGELIYLSEGPMSRYATNNMHRQFSEILRDSDPEDYLLLCGLNIMNCLACSVFSHLHNRLNLLLFKEGRYIERNLVFD